MGVPRFYRFLSERYPQINQKLSCQVGASGNTAQSTSFQKILAHDPKSLSLVNQIQQHSSSSFAVDCLYLDLNGVLHNVTHANSLGGRLNIRQTKDEIWIGIMNYIEGLVQIAKPSRLLFIGVDGVAPRAKMNQQRARRFRAAKDRSEYKTRSEGLRSRVSASEAFTAPPLFISDLIEFDSNCITPGTTFMQDLSSHLFFYLTQQLTKGGLWENIEVVLSGPDVPGEGEHKIMEFIRAMRSQADYPPDLSHCIQGLDADLIMLALMSHEPKFTLLREEVITDQEPRWLTARRNLISNEQQFVLLHISLVREYLCMDILSGLDSNAKCFFDKERVIDDFILVCCLSGNDFLPHLHFADISQGGMTCLINTYKEHLKDWDHTVEGMRGQPPWLLDEGGLINWPNFVLFLERCAKLENSHLKEQVADVSHLKKRAASRSMRSKSVASRTPVSCSPAPRVSAPESSGSGPVSSDRDIFEQSSAGAAQQVSDETDEEPNEPGMLDWVSLGRQMTTIEDVTGFYYYRKMSFDQFTPDGNIHKERLITKYLEGLQWNMRYYFDGVPSWSWFYPFHYPPFVRDLLSFLKENPDWRPQFSMGEPFRPFEQLMAVLPPNSAALVPAAYRPLMNDAQSPLIKMYPKHYKIDREGCKVSWGGVTLLPFIDEVELKNAMAMIEATSRLKGNEFKRNSRGSIHYFSARGDDALFILLLKKAGVVKLMTRKTMEFVSSTLPSHLPLLNGCKAVAYVFPDRFQFSDIQVGKHKSILLTDVDTQRSFFRNKNETPHDTNNARLLAAQPPTSTQAADKTHSRSPKRNGETQTTCNLCTSIMGANRIDAINFKAKLAAVFNKPTRNESLFVDIRPNWTGIKMEDVIRDWTIALIQSSNALQATSPRTLDLFDFSAMPSVQHAYPYQTMGKVIGLWSCRGYVALHPKAAQVCCSLLDDNDVITTKGEKMDDPTREVRWKELGGAVTGKMFHQVAAKEYTRVILSGRAFSQEPNATLTHLAHNGDLDTLMPYPEDAQTQTITGDVSWTDILVEVIDHEEVAQNLAGKPLMRYRQSASRLFFIPELDLIPVGLPGQSLHGGVSSAVDCLREGDSILSNSNEYIGLVGKLVSKRPWKAVFETDETPEDRRELQAAIDKIVQDYRSTKLLSLRTMAKRLSCREDALRWLLRKVLVRTGDRSAGPVDIGLGLISDVRHPLTGLPVPVCVPGYSEFHDGFYWFTEEALDLVKHVRRYLPCLMNALEEALRSKAQLKLADIFGGANGKKRKAEEDEWMLAAYMRWLVLQRCKTTGTAFGHAQTLPRKATIRIISLVDDFRARRLGRLPMTVTITNAHEILPLLSSPVTPARIVKNIGLGQRVVVIKATSCVNVGSTGFVSGILPSVPLDIKQVESCGDLLAEVVLDTPCIGGTDLNGQLPCPMRGLLIPLRHLLPLSPVVPEAHFYRDSNSMDNLKRTDEWNSPQIKQPRRDSVPPPPPPDFQTRRTPPPPPPTGTRPRGARPPRSRRGGRGARPENAF